MTNAKRCTKKSKRTRNTDTPSFKSPMERFVSTRYALSRKKTARERFVFILEFNPFQTGDRDNSYGDFLNDLMQKDGDNDDCRYAVYDYEYSLMAEGAESASFR